MANRVVHFEIHAENPERAAQFYVNAFGWEIKKWESEAMEYWMVMTGPKGGADAINGGLLRRKGPPPTDGQPMNGFCCTIDTEDFDASEAKILAHGGINVVPKATFAGMFIQGFYKDTEGNIFGLHQNLMAAK